MLGPQTDFADPAWRKNFAGFGITDSGFHTWQGMTTGIDSCVERISRKREGKKAAGFRHAEAADHDRIGMAALDIHQSGFCADSFDHAQCPKIDILPPWVVHDWQPDCFKGWHSDSYLVFDDLSDGHTWVKVTRVDKGAADCNAGRAKRNAPDVKEWQSGPDPVLWREF